MRKELLNKIEMVIYSIMNRTMDGTTMDGTTMDVTTMDVIMNKTTMNSYNRLCVFCTKKGIPGPHNHTIRDFSKKNHPIICPQLLYTTCTYCKKQGHTKNYCQLLQKKNVMDTSLSNKRSNGIDSSKEINTKSQKIGMLSAAFAGIDMD